MDRSHISGFIDKRDSLHAVNVPPYESSFTAPVNGDRVDDFEEPCHEIFEYIEIEKV